MISSPQFSRTAYRPDPERKSSAHTWAMNYLPGKTGLSVLEIGCATGQELSSLLQEFPSLRFTGLDISDENIHEAAELHPGARWVASDYMTFDTEPFDLIISERSLSIFQCTDDELASKLASDLAPNGIAVVTLPAPCLCTTVHFTLKRILRGIRSEFLDSLILGLARRLRPTLDEAALSDRLIYMYVVPLRIAGQKFRATLARHGLTVEEDHGVLRCTPFETPHRLLVLRKGGSIVQFLPKKARTPSQT
jgi:trans-aconitate 2-methyltransferase